MALLATRPQNEKQIPGAFFVPLRQIGLQSISTALKKGIQPVLQVVFEEIGRAVRQHEHHDS
jgi:hypothetical protein